MFKMFKSLVTTKASDMSNMTNAFEEINKSKSLMQNNTEVKDDKYEALFERGMFFLKKFSFSQNSLDDKKLLHEAANYFTKAIEEKQSKPDSYFYLSYIFYLIKEFDYAVNYLKVVTYLDPEFDGLEELKEKVTESQRISSMRSHVNPTVNTQKAKEIEVKKPLKSTSSVRPARTIVRYV